MEGCVRGVWESVSPLGREGSLGSNSTDSEVLHVSNSTLHLIDRGVKRGSE